MTVKKFVEYNQKFTREDDIPVQIRLAEGAQEGDHMVYLVMYDGKANEIPNDLLNKLVVSADIKEYFDTVNCIVISI